MMTPLLQLVTPIPTLPAGQATVNQLTWLLQAVDGFIAAVGPVIVPIARQWAALVAVGVLVCWCIKWGFDFVMHRGEIVLPEFIFFVLRLLGVSLMLGFYTVPIPAIGVPFPQLFTTFGNEIAATIDISMLNNLLTLINKCASGLEHPPAWNFFGLFVYFFVLTGMVVLDGVLLLITSLGFFAIGLGEVFGPIFIVCFLIPAWSRKFWNWVDFMFVYAFYRAMAAAFVYVVSLFLTNFFQTAVNGDYSIGHFTALLVLMLSSILMVVFGAFKVPHWTVELFGGGIGHAGSDFGQSVKAAIMTLAAA